MTLPRAIGVAMKTSSPKPGDNTLGKDWADVLAQVPLFASVPKRHLARIAKTAQAARFETGTTIVRKGSEGDAFFLILDGNARVSVPGRRSIKIGMGDFFGEMALLDGGARSATVTAETPLLAMKLPRRRFLPIVESESKIALALLKTLASRVRENQSGVD